MKIPEGYDEVISKDVDKEDCLILQKQFLDWFKQQDNVGKNCGQDAGRRFSAQ